MTDEVGYYTFENLPVLEEDQSYTVSIDQGASEDVLAPFNPTIENPDVGPALDSSTWTADSTGLTEDGESDPTLDFGFVQPMVSIGDFVWFDEDRDGLQGDDEPGIPGVVLEVTDPEGEPVTDVYGEPVGPVTTDEDGGYSFDGLPTIEEGQSYTVTIDQGASEAALAHLVPTLENIGDDSAVDSSTWTAESSGLTEDGDRDATLDFGFMNPSASVGDFVWEDENRNGIQDEDEPGIAGVVLEVTDPEGEPVTDVYGEPVGPMTTDGDGSYTFEDLPILDEGQSYTVTIDQEASEEALAEFIPTLEEQGDNRAEDSSTWAAQSEGLTEHGDRDPTLDFGFFVPTYAIGDIAWIDANDNGMQDGEEPLAGMTVELFTVDSDGDRGEEPMGTTTTGDDGRYIFDELPAGEYQVRFVLTEEQAELYEFTSYTSGDDATVDSNAGENGYSSVFTLNDNTVGITQDYDSQEFTATQGIDPTWDAGVVLLPEPAVEIVKGDGDAEAGTVDNDAGTEDEAVAYEDGETRDVVINVTNTGEEDLVDVVLTDETLSGVAVEDLVWTTPDGAEIAAENVDGVLTAAWDGLWAVGETITGVATLTLAEGEELHTNLASVTAVGAGTGTPRGG